uniref:Uncharacterized protein n=1 Tax=Anguilla anguilla TaxID=7936 RepID=A0A0E9QYI8_ANGAN
MPSFKVLLRNCVGGVRSTLRTQPENTACRWAIAKGRSQSERVACGHLCTTNNLKTRSRKPKTLLQVLKCRHDSTNPQRLIFDSCISHDRLLSQSL